MSERIASGETRQGGAVRTRGGVLSRGLDKLPPTELHKDDPVVKRFKERLADWERPFEPGDKQDG